MRDLPEWQQQPGGGYHAPLGLLETDWGGSTQEAWTDPAVAVSLGCSGEVPPQNATADRCPPGEVLSPTKPQHWGCLRNGMVAPLAPSLRPVLALWYQGEADSTNLPTTERDYTCGLRALIQDWRGMLQRPKLPFFLVQLAPYWQDPPRTNFPAVRVGQAAVGMDPAMQPAGYCVTHDIGDHAGGVHPHNKTEVGRRLALAVRRVAFNQTVHPWPEPIEARGASVQQGQGQGQGQEVLQVSFTKGVPGLALHWGPTHNCTQCCRPEERVVQVLRGNVWTDLAAAVDASGPVLQAQVPEGSAAVEQVRYAWSNYPECVLFDQHDLPVGPFLLSVSQ